MEKKPIYFSPEQSLLKARDWCAYQERCQQELRDKLYSYGLKSQEVENLIAQLISEGFVNEERFAKAYAGGKFRIKKWGKIKIKMALKAKQISEYCIRSGLAEIDPIQYEESLKKIIHSKAKITKESNILKKKQKLVQYALSRGYEQDLVYEAVASFLEEKN